MTGLNMFGVLRIKCFEQFEFLTFGPFTSGLGLNAFESFWCTMKENRQNHEPRKFKMISMWSF